METFYIEKIKRDNISSCVENILKRIAYFSNEVGNEDLLFYNIKLALWEIFSNFVCHGDEKSCEAIQIILEETKELICLSIISEGNEFDWEKYTCRGCPGVEEQRGRGIYILEQICHQFSYEGNGEIARLIFKKESQ